MPLRAIVDGTDTFSFDLTDGEWEQLRAKVQAKQVEIKFPCCNNRVGLRTSKLGTNHFYHLRRGDCTSAPETPEHLLAKRDIVIACREMGYQAITEYADDDWRADVMAIKGNARIAFEVQWSPQNLERTMERQERYKNAGVRGCWLFRKMPISEYHPIIRDLPMFQLTMKNNDSFKVIFEENVTYFLGEFVKSLLNGEIRYCDRITAKPEQEIKIQFIRTACWDCGAFYYVYRILSLLVTDCGRILPNYMDSRDSDSGLYFALHPEVIEAVNAFVIENEYSIDLGRASKYYAKWKNGLQDTFQCPHCKAKLGHPSLMKNVYDSLIGGKTITVDISILFITPPSIYKGSPGELMNSNEKDAGEYDIHGHWCMPENWVFCCDKSTPE